MVLWRCAIECFVQAEKSAALLQACNTAVSVMPLCTNGISAARLMQRYRLDGWCRHEHAVR